jgi:pimeloyl-ACP methyl ester carboxylesterase
MHREPAYLNRDGIAIAYHHHPARGSGAWLPGVVFLGGFMSDMQGGKALHLEATCRARGQQYTRLDYRGHGQSGGDFSAACISDWVNDAAGVLAAATAGPQVLVGSSMGGWIMLLLANRLPERIAGLVGIAPAPDFVERMEAGFSERQKAELAQHGHTTRPTPYAQHPYVITQRLLDDGRRNRVLTGAGHPFRGPVRILHGLEDDAVPWQNSLALAEKLASANVRITFIKGGDHRLSEPDQLAMLDATVVEVSHLTAAPTAPTMHQDGTNQ